jgi:hypothetical protein
MEVVSDVERVHVVGREAVLASLRCGEVARRGGDGAVARMRFYGGRQRRAKWWLGLGFATKRRRAEERQWIGNSRRGVAAATAFIGAAARVWVAVLAFALFDVTTETHGVECGARGTDAEARGCVS